MTTKEKLIKAVEELPDDVSIEDVMERLLFLAKVEKGIEQADKGQTVSHDDVKEKMSKWLK
jgi:predicted transcriptional regulator